MSGQFLRLLSRLRPLCGAVFLLALLPGRAAAQTAAPMNPAVQAPSATDLAAEIKKGLEDVQKNTSLNEDVKKRIQSLYEDARKKLDSAEGFRKQLAGLKSLRKTSSELEKGAAEELARPIGEPHVPDLKDLALNDVENRLKTARAEKEAAEANLAQWENEQKNRTQRREIVPKRLDEAKKELEKVQADLKASPPTGEAPETVRALRTLQHAQQQALKSEIAALKAEIPAYNDTDKIVDQLVKAARHRIDRAERAVKFWDKTRQEHWGKEARDQLNAAQNLIDNLNNRKLPDDLVAMARKNRELAEERVGTTDTTGTVELLKQVSNQIEDRDSQLEKLKADRKSLEEKLKIEGIAADLGLLLVIQRRRLPNVGDVRRQLTARRAELSRIQLKRADYRKLAEDLQKGLVEQTSAAVDTIGVPANDADRSVVEASVRLVLKQRQGILESLARDYDTLAGRMLHLNEKDQQLINDVESFRALIDKQILWVPTAKPLGVEHFEDDIEDAGAALKWLASPARWKSAAMALAAAVFDRPASSALAVLLLALALLKQRSMKRRLIEAGEQAAKGFTEPYGLTGKALLLTAALAAIWPGVLGFAGWRLDAYTGAGSTNFTDSVGTALMVAAVALLTLEFLRRMYRSHGLAEAHFRWKDARLQKLRRHVRWFAAIVVPGVFLYSLIQDYGDETYTASLGRLLLMSLLLVTSVFLAVVFRNPRVKYPFEDRFGADHSVATAKASAWQVAAYLGVVLFPVALAILAAAGYLYTADFLTRKLLLTAWLGLVLLVVHAMSIRWLYHMRGRLALEQAQAVQAQKAAEQAALAATAASTETASPIEQSRPTESSNGNRPVDSGEEQAEATTDTSPAATAITPAPPAADLAAINAQTRRLLRISIATGAVVGLWLIWGDVLPALKFLQVPLWHYQAQIAQKVASNNMKVPETITVLQPFTLGDLLLLAAIIAVVFVAAANLPGLLEVALLQRLPIDSGARYAASSLARYTIYGVGIVAAVNTMGIDWNKIILLFAALGVGLGFGLQEIFANFVSGIILLFERPLRVGDIVTIGDVSGVVTKIHIRATTIRNWDRKEYIVPNKELVAGKLMNWTLSDSISRLVINVGVKYGSDADRVTELLRDVVTSHPNVMSDPAPLITFESFGDSALNFVVRCYVPAIGMRLDTIHALHSEIQRRLDAAGIEIPFPQRDLHIRSDDTLGNGSLSRRRQAGDGQEQTPGVSPVPAEEVPLMKD